MKYTKIIQLVIVIAAVFTFLKIIPDFLSIVTIFRYEQTAESLRGYIAFGLIDLLALSICYYLLRRSFAVAVWINNQASFHFETKIIIKHNALLAIGLVFMGITGMINYLPKVVMDIYFSFKDKVPANTDFTGYEYRTYQPDLLWNVIYSLIYFLLIVFSKKIADFILNKIVIKDDEIIIDDNSVL